MRFEYQALYKGLNQIPTRALKRGLKRILKNPKDIIYNGKLINFPFSNKY